MAALDIINSENEKSTALLERIFMFLEDGEWEKADTYCEKVLDQDPQNARAYLGKLMAEQHAKTQDDLKNCEKPFDGSNNYQKVLRFADTALSDELNGYIAFINDRNENTRLTEIYNKAKKQLETAKNEKDCKNAAADFASIPGFEDADALMQQCLEKSEECRTAAQKAAKKRKKIIAITAPVVCVCIAIVIVLTPVIIPKQKLNKAMTLIDSGNYEEAYTLLYTIPKKYSSEYLGNYIVVPTKGIKTYSDGDKSTYEYEYDCNGNMTKEILTKSHSSRCTRAEYEYDCNGNMTKKIFTNFDGKKSTHEYEYDRNGNVTKKILTNSDGDKSTSEYEYDRNGNQIKEICTNSHGDKSTFEYEYDRNGNQIKEICTNFFGGKSTTEYEYDRNGNLIKEIYTESDGSRYTPYEYEYDSNGNMTKKIYTNSDGDKSAYEYEYDSNGNKIKEIYTESDGSQYTSAEYEYDRNGNVIKEIRTLFNGEKYTFEYSGYLYFYKPY